MPDEALSRDILFRREVSWAVFVLRADGYWYRLDDNGKETVARLAEQTEMEMGLALRESGWKDQGKA